MIENAQRILNDYERRLESTLKVREECSAKEAIAHDKIIKFLTEQIAKIKSKYGVKTQVPVEAPPKKKRGRPKKSEAVKKVPKKRGRPKKVR